MFGMGREQLTLKNMTILGGSVKGESAKKKGDSKTTNEAVSRKAIMHEVQYR
jgi:hypothetical protein